MIRCDATAMEVGAVELPVHEGDVLAGKYRVGRVIAQGASGVVVAARHIPLGRDVALKCLLRFPLRGPEAIPRFQQEARATATIQSEHVVRLLDVDLLPTGEPFLVLELLEGVDLKTMLAQRGRLDLREVADIVLQACDAIAEAHHLNIVHRDIKPANIFLAKRPDGSPFVKVLDFGLAKVGERMRVLEVATATGSVLGSALYMAPEQAESSKDVDRRVDVWALGTLIYELLAGEPPFASVSVAKVLDGILNRPAPPLRGRRADVPTSIEQLVARCLEKDRARRPTHVGEIVLALAPFASPDLSAEVGRVSKLYDAATVVPAPPTRTVVPAPQPAEGRVSAPPSTQPATQPRASAPPSTQPQDRVSAPPSTQAPPRHSYDAPPPASAPPSTRRAPTNPLVIAIPIALVALLALGTLAAYKAGFLHAKTHPAAQ